MTVDEYLKAIEQKDLDRLMNRASRAASILARSLDHDTQRITLTLTFTDYDKKPDVAVQVDRTRHDRFDVREATA